MELAQEIKQMSNIVSQWENIHIDSTAALKVTYTGNLYNVDGSTRDPKIDGQNWKPLLISEGIIGTCYVTNAIPVPGASHPEFNVGGHMTPNSNGIVDDGGTCYLMPLCSWHNNKARDGIEFTHTETSMLKLTGYMEGEMAVTFMARLPSKKPFSLVYYSDGDWHQENLTNSEVTELESQKFSGEVRGRKLGHYVLLERVAQYDQTHYLVHSTQLL